MTRLARLLWRHKIPITDRSLLEALDPSGLRIAHDSKHGASDNASASGVSPLIKATALFLTVTLLFWFTGAPVYAGQLQFDGVPVDITPTSNEALVVPPGEGGVTQVGDKTGGTRDIATTNDDLFITNNLEVEGKGRSEG